jgi:hypothetical protein
MPKLFDALPFFVQGGKNTSRKGYALDQPLELWIGPATSQGRAPATVADPAGRPVEIKSSQILTWLTLGFRNRSRSDRYFPTIVDPGNNHYLVASEWHLVHWAQAATYNFLDGRIRNLVRETVANSPHAPAAPSPKPLGLLNRVLGDVWNQWKTNQIKDWLPVIETDIWLPANEPGERDELRSATACYCLRIPAIVVRPGTAARPPLLGMAALQQGRLKVSGRPIPLDRLEIDLKNSEVHLSY